MMTAISTGATEVSQGDRFALWVLGLPPQMIEPVTGIPIPRGNKLSPFQRYDMLAEWIRTVRRDWLEQHGELDLSGRIALDIEIVDASERAHIHLEILPAVLQALGHGEKEGLRPVFADAAQIDRLTVRRARPSGLGTDPGAIITVWRFADTRALYDAFRGVEG